MATVQIDGVYHLECFGTSLCGVEIPVDKSWCIHAQVSCAACLKKSVLFLLGKGQWSYVELVQVYDGKGEQIALLKQVLNELVEQNLVFIDPDKLETTYTLAH